MVCHAINPPVKEREKKEGGANPICILFVPKSIHKYVASDSKELILTKLFLFISFFFFLCVCLCVSVYRSTYSLCKVQKEENLLSKQIREARSRR